MEPHTEESGGRRPAIVTSGSSRYRLVHSARCAISWALKPDATLDVVCRSLFPCADRPNVKIMDTAHAWTLQQEGADSSDICPRRGRSD
jgi:hypothetical protein